MDLQFLFPGSKHQDFEQFLSTMWTVGGSNSKKGAGYVKFMTSRIAQI